MSYFTINPHLTPRQTPHLISLVPLSARSQERRRVGTQPFTAPTRVICPEPSYRAVWVTVSVVRTICAYHSTSEHHELRAHHVHPLHSPALSRLDPECCDGSDEATGICPNVCDQVGKEYRSKRDEERKRRKTVRRRPHPTRLPHDLTVTHPSASMLLLSHFL